MIISFFIERRVNLLYIFLCAAPFLHFWISTKILVFSLLTLIRLGFLKGQIVPPPVVLGSKSTYFCMLLINYEINVYIFLNFGGMVDFCAISKSKKQSSKVSETPLLSSPYWIRIYYFKWISCYFCSTWRTRKKSYL